MNPFPTPTNNGLLCFAAYNTPGACSSNKPNANDPRISFNARRKASLPDKPSFSAKYSTKFTATSVSV